MRAHLKELDAKKPVVYVGDLNVAHRDEDIWNVTASRIKKSAGTTPQEREAFGVMLEENKLVDAFRFFHEGATGWFSYWSVRAGNRPFNKGLRLDYTLASRRLFDGGSDGVEVVDAFILDEYQGSDHSPVGIPLAVPCPIPFFECQSAFVAEHWARPRDGPAAPREALVPQPLDDAGHRVGDVVDPVVADLRDEVAAGLPSVRAALKQVNSHRRAHLFRPSLPENGPKR